MQFLDKAGLTTLVDWANGKFATKFIVVSANNKAIGTDKDSTGVTFTGGSNKFTVSDGTNSFDVDITPNITNNVTGSGTSGQVAVFNNANSLTGRDVATSIADNTNIPTSSAVKSYVDTAIDGIETPNDGTFSIIAVNADLVTEEPAYSAIGSTSANSTNNTSVKFIGANATRVSGSPSEGTITISSYDEHVTSVDNHYRPSANDSSALSADASGATAAWGIDVVTGVNIQRDAKGHVTGVTVDSGKIPTNPVDVNTVTSSSTLTADKVILGAGNKEVKTSDYTLGGSTLGNTTGADKRLATEAAVVDAMSGLSGAMHYIGTSTSVITDGGTENPTISGYSGTAKTAGNVVVYGSKEFVWNGSAWEEFGDEGSYALKTVSITGTGALSGGGTLTENRTITHNISGVTAATYGPSANVTGTNDTTILVPEITVDAYGHITGVTNRTYTSKDTTYTALKNPNAINIGTKPSTSGAAIDKITYDGSVDKGLYFSSAAASNTNVQFAIDDNGFITGTVAGSVDTDRYVNSAAFTSQGTNGADGTKMTLTRAGSDTATVTATIPVATTSAAGVMSGAMVDKLSGIETGAQANVKPDWNAASGSTAEILNKPTIPAAANNAKLQIKGSASNATATDTGFTANASSDGVIVFEIGASGNTISSITTNGNTVTINGASIDVDEAISDAELDAILYPTS